MRRNHTKAFKEEAIKLGLEEGYAISDAALNLGVNPSLLGRWKREIEKNAGGYSGAGSMMKMQAELKHLRKENKRLKLEREILKEADLLRERNGLRYQFIDTEKKGYTIVLLCQVMRRVSQSGYYSWRKREESPRQIENESLIPYGFQRSPTCGLPKAAYILPLFWIIPSENCGLVHDP